MPPDYLGSAALGAGVSGLFGIAGSAINYAFQKKLAAQQNQYNLDMWRMQADYNSPQAQMQRFQEAGLNPNLIYGQGSNGNMSQAPQMVTPEAPNVSKEMQELGKAFNIESIRTMVANRKKAQHEERIAELNMFDREDEREALSRLTHNYDYDFATGKWILSPNDGVSANSPRGTRVGNNMLGEAYLKKFLASQDPRMQMLALQRSYLAPQIQMANYDWKYYPYSYWIGQGSKVAGAAGNLINSIWPKIGFSRKMGSTPKYEPTLKRSTYFY